MPRRFTLRSVREVAALLSVVGAAVVACSSSELDRSEGAEAAVAEGSPPPIGLELGVLDFDTLHALEGKGLSFADALGVGGESVAARLGDAPLYETIAETIAADVKDTQSADPAAGVGVGKSHRTFDPSWLRSPKVSFSLVGILNRVDMMTATPGSCGVTRVVYRMKYETKQARSRLPLTVAFLYPQAAGPNGDCKSVVQKWRSLPKDADGLAAALANQNTGILTNLTRPGLVEINVQSVRWPAAVRPDMGGHTEYVFHMLRPSASGGYVPAPLENTPDPRLSAEKREELRAWIGAHLDEIERGEATLPAEFLAKEAVAVSPHGLARAANRPFLQLFPRPNEAFGDLALEGRTNIGSPAALVRHLDGGTCQGCHQGRALGGFHLLGEEQPDTPALNRIEVGFSPAMLDELRWRKTALDAIANGERPGPRLPCEREAGPGGNGARCDLGKVKGLEKWGCADGLTCMDVAGDEVGVCLSNGAAGGGEQCESSEITFEPDPHKDQISVKPMSCKSGLRCSSMRGGFPNGSCSGPCPTMGKVLDGTTICGAAPPSGFNECIARGTFFTECLKGAASVVRRSCSIERPCPDDYVCAGVPNAPRGQGACMPPYFIFQARVDGHVVK